MKITSRILCTVLCVIPCSVALASKPDIQKKRVNGNWEVHCSTELPTQAKKLDHAIGQLRTQCEIAALRLAVKEHSRHGASPKAVLSKEKIDKEHNTISVVAALK